jgi:membrane associated rhomboid family serine protease
VLFGAYDITNPTGGGGGVAYFAHIGGFAFGLALIKVFATRRKEVGPRLPVY